MEARKARDSDHTEATLQVDRGEKVRVSLQFTDDAKTLPTPAPEKQKSSGTRRTRTAGWHQRLSR